MSPVEASAIIGCSPAHVRFLCRKGKLSSKKLAVKHPTRPELDSHEYRITPAEATRYAATVQGRGYPRGRKRTIPHSSS